MKAKLLAVPVASIVLILGGLFVTANKSYACGNQSPYADLTVRSYVIRGNRAPLDGRRSYDPDGNITKYEWDFNDIGEKYFYDYSETSSSYPDGAFDGVTTHIYDTNGTYTVTLRVIDNHSATDTDTVDVNVGLDLDGDGLPGAWENLYNGLSDANFSDADEDLDGDGYNNLSEYLHVSEPNVSTSVPDTDFPITIYVPSDVNSIQRAINAAIDGDTIVVSEGTYYEVIDFNGVSCTLTSTDHENWEVTADTIIDANDPSTCVVIFENSEGTNSVLKGFTITGGDLGIYCNGASPTISNCLITGNGDGTGIGGGMYDANCSPTVTNCFFSDNNSLSGGGIYDYNSSPTVVSCVFADNVADANGGGMCNEDSSPIVINCTFSGNSAGGDGGGVYNKGASSTPKLTNCIFWGDDATGSGDEVYNYASADPNFSYSDIKGSGGSSGWDPNFGTNGGGNIDSDPNFTDANNPAGQDGVFGTSDDGLRLEVIQTYSPCIDRADSTVGDFPSTDIVGRVRVDIADVTNTGKGDPNYADLGAYESPEIWFVDDDATGSDNGSSWADAFSELYNALTSASDGDEIWVAEGTYKPESSSRSNSFVLKDGIGVYGGFAGTESRCHQRDWTLNKAILSGDIGTPDNQSDNSYHVVKGADRAILDGFTITGGNADGSGINSKGGGIYCNNVSPTIRNCAITANKAYDIGGGTYNYSCSPSLINCIFSGNQALGTGAKGGGICNYRASSSLVNCTFSTNQATDAGGGMYNTPDSIPTVTNCIFWADTANSNPEIYNTSRNPIFSYSNIQGCGGSGDGWDHTFGTDLGGNIDSDPYFKDLNKPDGNDGSFGTWDDGLRLKSSSPCIDAADGYATPSADILGLDRIDISGVDNTGAGIPDYADIGGYESYGNLDSDNDNMPDDYEIIHGLNPNDSSDASKDKDGDGLSNLLEYQIGTWASNDDTDRDGMDDGWEHTYGLDPLYDDANEDADGDGINNIDEYKNGSNPNVYNAVTVIVYQYNNAGDVLKETIQDKVGNNLAVTQYQYDELGRRWQQRRWASAGGSDDVNDMITLYSYDVRSSLKKTVRKGVGGNNPDIIQSDYDLITENFYNSLARLTDVNDPCGGNMHYTYYAGGHVKDVTDPNGNITRHYYDNAGRLAKITDGQSHYRLSYYDSLGRTIKQFACDSGDKKLMQTRFEYNALGRVTRRAVMADADSTSAISTSVDMVVDYNYADTNGLLIYEKMYYAGGTAATTYYEYDGLGRRTTITDPCGNQTLLTYDEVGQVIRRQQIEKDPLGSNDLTITTDYYYDSLGRLYQQAIYESGDTWHVTTYKYNPLGNRTWEIKPDGTAIKYSFNALGQLLEKIADEGVGQINQKTEYGYDRLGRQTEITGYADGSTAQTTKYTYDGLDRVTNVEYPDGNDIDFEYNKAGKVVKRTDQRGIVTDYTYNGTYNMLTKEATVDSVTTTETFTYDGLGRMLTATKVVDMTTISETEFAYSDLGRVTDANEKLFTLAKKEMDFSYDQAGFLTSTTYPYSSVVINITPDWQGRIDTLKLNTITMVTYQYIGSRVAKRSYFNNYVKYEPTYDNLGRVTTQRSYNTVANIAKFDYQYEPYTNNISKQTYDHRTGDPCTDFSYDNLDRLRVAEYSIQDNNEVFTIDDLGNRDSVNLRNGSDEDYVIDNLTNRYDSVGGNNLTYDEAGNLTKDKDSYTYHYDYENRIVKITKTSQTKAEFAYDALGRRIRKIDSVAGETTLYYNNPKWQVLCEYNGSDEFQRWFAYGNYIDEVLIMSTSSALPLARFYIHDHLYSPAALTSFVGVVLERYEYDAYGNCNVLEPNFAPDSDGESDYGNPYLFTGRRIDILDSGSLIIQYSRHRYYDYYTGRWLTHDPLGINPAGGAHKRFAVLQQYRNGMNLYEYVHSNPTDLVDPFGRSWRRPEPEPTPPIGRSWRRPEPEPTPPIPRRGWHDYAIITNIVFDCYEQIDRSKPCKEGDTKAISRCWNCEWSKPGYKSLGWRKRLMFKDYWCEIKHLHYKCKCCKWELTHMYPRGFGVTDCRVVKQIWRFQRWYGWRWPP